MLNWLRRRRLSSEARRKLLILAARSEEAIIETHVANALELLDALGDEVDLDRGIELYREMMLLPERFADLVKTRILSRVESPAGDGRSGAYQGVFSSRAEKPRRAPRRSR